MAKPHKDNLPTQKQVSQFLMLKELLTSVYLEMKEFSKKKPEEALNKFKVKNINRILEPLKEILEYQPTISFLDILDDDTLPSNSDAIIIISQFTAAMNTFHNKYYYKSKFENIARWSTKENPILH